MENKLQFNKHNLIIAAALFFLVFIIYALSPNITSYDSRWVIPVSMSILKERNTNLDEYHELIAQQERYAIVNIDGSEYNFYPIGTSIIVLPMVAAVDLIYSLSGKNYSHVLKSSLPGRIEKFQASLIAALTVALLFLIIQAKTGDRKTAIACALIFAFCTSSWSTSSRALWQHGPSALMFCIAIYVFIKQFKEHQFLIIAGVAMGFAYGIRPNNILPCFLFLIYAFIQYRKSGFYYLAGLIISVLPFIIYNLTLYQSPTTSYTLDLFTKDHIGYHTVAWGLLFSPSRGLFIYSPVFIFAFYSYWKLSKTKTSQLLDHFLAIIIGVYYILLTIYPPLVGRPLHRPSSLYRIHPALYHSAQPIHPYFIQSKKNQSSHHHCQFLHALPILLLTRCPRLERHTQQRQLQPRAPLGLDRPPVSPLVIWEGGLSSLPQKSRFPY